MQVVIDANIIMAMLIKPGKPIDLFFTEELEIFAPELLFKEVEQNAHVIGTKSGLNQEDLDGLLQALKRNITVVSEDLFIDCLDAADGICPDPKDVIYFALALHLKCPIWTNEKQLRNQTHIKVYLTHELMNMFGLST